MCKDNKTQGQLQLLHILKPCWVVILEFSLVVVELQSSVSDSSWYLKVSSSIPGHSRAGGCVWMVWLGTAGDFSSVSWGNHFMAEFNILMVQRWNISQAPGSHEISIFYRGKSFTSNIRTCIYAYIYTYICVKACNLTRTVRPTS